MKNINFRNLLICLMCCFCLFGLISCQNNFQERENTETQKTIPTEITASFDTVEDFKIAVKKDPENYNGKRISIKGYANVLTLLNKTVWLYDDSLPDDQKYDGRPRVRVVIADSVKLSVIEDNDYVELNGVVIISTEETYLDHCTYTMIKTNEEQKN